MDITDTDLLYNYHKNSNIICGLDLEEYNLEDILVSDTECIMCEDWRDMNNSGSSYYKIYSNNNNNITIKDILMGLKNNIECDKLYNNQEYNTLIDISKKTNIHYLLWFDC
tara:strand:- start:1262 stop:1594 length:333 start_codon:yes stop_codon:yes gene_type:complete